MRKTSSVGVVESDLVPGFCFRYRWKGKQWITLEVMRIKFDKVQCTPPTTNLRHRFINIEDVLASARKLDD